MIALSLIICWRDHCRAIQSSRKDGHVRLMFFKLRPEDHTTGGATNNNLKVRHKQPESFTDKRLELSSSAGFDKKFEGLLQFE